MKKELRNELKAFLAAEDAVSTVEIILIAVALIALVVVFKENMKGVVENIINNVESKANGV